VYLPELQELYSIDKVKGAVCNGERLTARDARLAESLVIGGFSGAKGDPELRRRQYAFFGAVNDSSRGCIRLGTAAVTLSWVAAGRAQAAYAVNAQLWDAAGALAIAQAAGCRIWHAREAGVAGGSTRISYIVGAPGTCDEVLKLGQEKGIF
jgi:myo-inositol-1(or 4)-monophosphatase